MIRLDREIEAKYEILAKMGEGGFGSVYKVRHKVFQEIRVIKTAKYPESDTAERTRFISEAKRGYHFRHDSIARVLDFEITGEGTAYIAMEFIDGMNLREMLAVSRIVLEPERVIDIACQALDALGYLHERGVVHRDISPDNLMLTRDGRHIKLIDLGIAKSMEASQSLTLAGRFIGKVSYAAPEQFSGNADPRSDLYALGVVMYELLTGSRPVRSTDAHAIIAAHIMGELRKFDETDPEGRVPQNLRNVVMRALRREPDERFQTAADFASALQRLGNAPPVEKTHTVEIASEDLAALKASRSEQVAWEAALAADSPNAWEDFLARYGASARAKSARARLDELERIEEQDWNGAANEETRDAWSRYLAKHPASPRAPRARRRVEKLDADEKERQAFDDADRADTVSAWQQFLREHADSERASAAQSRLAAARDHEEEQRAWNAADTADTAAAWRDYAKHYPRSHRADIAKERLAVASAREAEAREWDLASAAASAEALRAFVGRYPNSSRRAAADEQLRSLLRAADEDAAWSEASSANSAEGWRDYLQRYGDSPRAADARRSLAAAQEFEREERDWFAAAAADTPDGWRGFLKLYPHSARAASAHARLASAEAAVAEDGAWREATASASAAAWRTYLDRFPKSHRVADAQRNLAAAEADDAASRAFADASKADAVASWRDFLERHGATRFAADARQLLASATAREDDARRRADDARARDARDRARRAGTIDALEEFLGAFGDSRYAGEVRAQLDAIHAEKRRIDQEASERERADAARQAAEERAWSVAVKRGAIAGLEAFLEAHPQSSHAAEARRRIAAIQESARDAARQAAVAAEERAWSAAVKRDAVAGFDAFVDAHPQSSHAAEARERIAALQVRERDAARQAAIAAEERAWSAAVKRDAVAGFEAFVAAHPQSSHAAEARERIAALRKNEGEARRQTALAASERAAWATADKGSAIADYEAFLAAHPQSVYAAQARERIAAIQESERQAAHAAVAAEQRAWQRATKRNRIADLEAFIAAWPQSRYVADANTLAGVISAATSQPEPRRPPRAIIAATAVAAVVAAVTAAVVWWPHAAPVPAPQPAAVATAPTSQTTPAPPIPPGTGVLVMNAFPWGEVTSIKETSTKREHVDAGRKLYTPATIALPPGKYEVVLSNPNSRKSVSRVVTVAAAETARVEAALDTVDPADYLNGLQQ